MVWGVLMVINLAWPRREVYNATEPFHWYLQWGAVLFVGTVLFGGLAYYLLVHRHKTGVLAAHSAVAVVARPSPGTVGAAE